MLQKQTPPHTWNECHQRVTCSYCPCWFSDMFRSDPMLFISARFMLDPLHLIECGVLDSQSRASYIQGKAKSIHSPCSDVQTQSKVSNRLKNGNTNYIYFGWLDLIKFTSRVSTCKRKTKHLVRMQLIECNAWTETLRPNVFKRPNLCKNVDSSAFFLSGSQHRHVLIADTQKKRCGVVVCISRVSRSAQSLLRWDAVLTVFWKFDPEGYGTKESPALSRRITLTVRQDTGWPSTQIKAVTGPDCSPVTNRTASKTERFQKATKTSSMERHRTEPFGLG